MPTQLTDKEVIKECDDLEMMRRPHLWSNNYLHLKKPHPDRLTHYRFALLYKEKGVWAIFPLKPGLDLLDLEQKRTGGDELLVQLIKEGWVVD